MYGGVPHLGDSQTLDLHFCIQVAAVNLDTVVLPDATATSEVFVVDASPNRMN